MCDLHQFFDQSFQILDFGPEGFAGPAELKFCNEPIYGASISVVACTNHEVNINIRDGTDAILLHVVPRPYANEFGLSSFFNGWIEEEKLKENPVKKGVRFSLMIKYEKEGYRIFVNGKEVAFYKHRSESIGTRLQITNCHVYKITYLTTVMQCVSNRNGDVENIDIRFGN